MWRGITSLILSIISLFFCWLGIVGAIIGMLGLYDSQYSEQYPNDKGLCCAGIVIGCISIFVFSIILGFLVSV
nr:MAG TPA: protein of unknown function (DUF4190) [Caudoviricetes sp.]